MTTPRPAQGETARQIQRYDFGDVDPFGRGEYVAHDDHAAEVASLTAALAQAQQERDEWKKAANLTLGDFNKAIDRLAEAQQARDAAHQHCADMALERDEAARTALLTTAEKWRTLSEHDFEEWLNARSDKEIPHA